MSLIEKYLIGSVHHPLSCSKFPAWSHCGGFDGGDIDPADLTHPANRGTLQHAYIEQMIKGDVDGDLVKELTTEECEGCEWAMGFLDGKKAMSEHKVRYMNDDFEEVYTSTLDLQWYDEGVLNIADIKTGEQRSYAMQLAGYALASMQMEGVTECVCHEVYTKFKKVETYRFTYDDAKGQVESILATRKANVASKCSYCGWCSHIEDCPEIVTDVVTVAEGYADLHLDSWHPSELTDPNQMLTALKVAKVLEGWCKSVKHHANDMAIKQGLPIPGTKVKTRKGKQSLTDVNEAFSLSGFTPEEFMSVCTVSVPNLADIEKERTGESKAKARKSLESRLGAVIKSGKDSTFLELEK